MFEILNKTSNSQNIVRWGNTRRKFATALKIHKIEICVLGADLIRLIKFEISFMEQSVNKLNRIRSNAFLLWGSLAIFKVSCILKKPIRGHNMFKRHKLDEIV